MAGIGGIRVSFNNVFRKAKGFIMVRGRRLKTKAKRLYRIIIPLVGAAPYGIFLKKLQIFLFQFAQACCQRTATRYHARLLALFRRFRHELKPGERADLILRDCDDFEPCGHFLVFKRFPVCSSYNFELCAFAGFRCGLRSLWNHARNGR